MKKTLQGGSWPLRFRFWQNRTRRMYILSGMTDFMTAANANVGVVVQVGRVGNQFVLGLDLCDTFCAATFRPPKAAAKPSTAAVAGSGSGGGRAKGKRPRASAVAPAAAGAARSKSPAVAGGGKSSGSAKKKSRSGSAARSGPSGKKKSRTSGILPAPPGLPDSSGRAPGVSPDAPARPTPRAGAKTFSPKIGTQGSSLSHAAAAAGGGLGGGFLIRVPSLVAGQLSAHRSRGQGQGLYNEEEEEEEEGEEGEEEESDEDDSPLCDADYNEGLPPSQQRQQQQQQGQCSKHARDCGEAAHFHPVKTQSLLGHKQGCRPRAGPVCVWWTLEGRWFEGVVRSPERDGAQLVEYTNGQTMYHDLLNESWTFPALPDSGLPDCSYPDSSPRLLLPDCSIPDDSYAPIAHSAINSQVDSVAHPTAHMPAPQGARSCGGEGNDGQLLDCPYTPPFTPLAGADATLFTPAGNLALTPLRYSPSAYLLQGACSATASSKGALPGLAPAPPAASGPAGVYGVDVDDMAWLYAFDSACDLVL
ncbi:hypothetical protein T492DRAFT_213385 [Pavlovales sp. CCMP2436]|nr:hypothetical protein T492DRAFT_213385 [Pavlovales sp. CCMP2436]